MIAQQANAFGNFIIVRDDGAAVSQTTECFGGIKAEHSRNAERARETVVSYVSPGRPIARAAEGNLAGESWDRDEWDVTLADRVTYRIFRERDSGKWFMEGTVD